MDSSDAIAVVNERIKKFETEEIARKVLGYIYIQDYSLQELIPLALGPDIAIQNLILTGKAALQLPSAAVDFSPISSLVNPISNADHLLQFSSTSPQHPPLSPWVAEARLWKYEETEQQAVPEFMGFKDQFHGQYLPKNNSHNFGPKTNEFGYEDQVFLPGSLKRLEMEMTELLKSRGGGPIPISFVPMLYFERYGRTIRAQDYPIETQSIKLTKLLARLNNTIRILYKPEGQHEIVLAEHVPVYLGIDWKHHEQHDRSLYSSHMYTESELPERLLTNWMAEELAKTAEIETKSFFNRDLWQSPDANQAYFDCLIYESRVSQDGRHEEINHIDPDSSHEFDLPYKQSSCK